MESVIEKLKDAGYDYAVAISTESEQKANAACGQLSLVVELDTQENS
jgi:adenine C2-methylase RlmN of 23S rRNA A2503 and tRNA A37